MTGLSITTHPLKTWPCYFDKVAKGEKTFEIRFDDRGYQRGDILLLQEYLPESEDDKELGIVASGRDRYTGRECRAIVTYVTSFHQKPGFVVMSIQLMAEKPERKEIE